jgi:hypothetical protein
VTPEDTPKDRMDELKDLERQRGQLFREPRTRGREDALEVIGRLQRLLVDAMAKARKRR